MEKKQDFSPWVSVMSFKKKKRGPSPKKDSKCCLEISFNLAFQAESSSHVLSTGMEISRKISRVP